MCQGNTRRDFKEIGIRVSSYTTCNLRMVYISFNYNTYIIFQVVLENETAKYIVRGNEMMPVKEGCTRASQGRSLMGSNPYVEFYLPLCEKIAEMYVLYFLYFP